MFKKNNVKKIFYILVITVICHNIFLKVSISQWQQAGGPYGGTITSFALSDNKIFAATEGAGIVYSTNNGINWNTINSGLSYRNMDVVYVYREYLFAASADGIFLSTNDGENWVLSNNGIPNRCCGKSFTADDINLYVAVKSSYGGIFKSTNNGQFWTEVGKGQLTAHNLNYLLSVGGNLLIYPEEKTLPF